MRLGFCVGRVNGDGGFGVGVGGGVVFCGGVGGGVVGEVDCVVGGEG